jgi:DNA-binding transcriptional ArsR family regulator
MFAEQGENMEPSILEEATAAHVAELFRTFSDTSRVRILSFIMQQEMNITTLAEMVGVTESAVSHHMRGLRQMRMVKSRRDGKEVFYSVDDPHIIALFQEGVRHVQED